LQGMRSLISRFGWLYCSGSDSDRAILTLTVLLLRCRRAMTDWLPNMTSSRLRTRNFVTKIRRLKGLPPRPNSGGSAGYREVGTASAGQGQEAGEASARAGQSGAGSDIRRSPAPSRTNWGRARRCSMRIPTSFQAALPHQTTCCRRDMAIGLKAKLNQTTDRRAY